MATVNELIYGKGSTVVHGDATGQTWTLIVDRHGEDWYRGMQAVWSWEVPAATRATMRGSRQVCVHDGKLGTCRHCQ